VAGAGHVLRLPRLRGSTRSDWAQLLRFAIVGGSGYLVNLTVFVIATGVGATHIEAALVAFVVALLNNYALNRAWTFTGHAPTGHVVQLSRYTLVSLVALGLNLAVLQILVTAGVRDVAAQTVGILCATPVNFLLNRRWSFR